MQLNDVASIVAIVGTICGIPIPFIVYGLQKRDNAKSGRAIARLSPLPASEGRHETPDLVVDRIADRIMGEMRSAQAARYIRREKVAGWTQIVVALLMLLFIRALLGQWPPLPHWIIMGALAGSGAYRLFRLSWRMQG